MIDSGIIFIIEKNMFDEISIISLARLIDGGAAILHALKQNHQKVKEGKRFRRPDVT